MKLSVTKSGNACGAEIKFDLSSELDDRTFAEIEQTFHDNIVVYFRGQQLSNERHIEFSRRFGGLEIHVLKKYLLPNYPEILLISNIKDENGENIGLADAGFTWHTDVSYLKRPSRCSLLYAKEVPYRDGRPLGDTLFTNTIAAYKTLPETMKRRLMGLKAIHRYSARKRVANSPRPKLTKKQLEETPDVAHPIVRTHAWTGRKSLYVTAGECIGIEGLPDDVRPACACGEDPRTFADALLTLLDQPASERRARANRASLESLTWDSTLKPACQILAAAGAAS